MGLSLRLRRLADRLSQDARRVYRDLGHDLEPGWHAILLLLAGETRLGVSDVARALGVSHPSTSALLAQLFERGYIESSRDPQDGRRRLVRLTPAAREALGGFEATWRAFESALAEILTATDQDVLGALDALEDSVSRRPLDERVLERLAPARAESAGYAPSLSTR